MKDCQIYIDVEPGKKNYEALKKSRTLEVKGLISNKIPLRDASYSISSIYGCSVVVIAVMPSLYEEVFPKVADYLTPGTLVCFFPGSFGALLFSGYLKSRGFDPSTLTIAESVSYPCVCKEEAPGEIVIQSIKSELDISVSPKEKEAEVLEYINGVFGIYNLSASFMATSMDNINMTLHPFPVLLNIGAVENKDIFFRHYIEGVSPTIGRLMDQVDEERLRIGEAYGVKLKSALDQLKVYYGEYDAHNLYEYVSREDGPYKGVGKFGLSSRYIEEDIPYLLVPAIYYAERNGVDIPVMKFCVELARMITGKNYYEDSFNIRYLDF